MRGKSLQLGENTGNGLGEVWIDCSYPVIALGLASIMEPKARLHYGEDCPRDHAPSLVVLHADDVEDLSVDMERVRSRTPDAQILVFNSYMDLPLARAALRSGARGFIHAGMKPAQIIRALSAVIGGEIAAPRKLLELLVTEDAPDNDADLEALSSRQREILDLVSEGLSNAQIAANLYLSESTVKQHLRAAFKLLRVNNRTEAAKLARATERLDISDATR